MLNDYSTAKKLLATRRSGKASQLEAPGPSETDLLWILEIAMRVPDHGKLAPWRFFIVGKKERSALNALFEAALKAEKPNADKKNYEKMNKLAHSAPCLVVVLAKVDKKSSVPIFEQHLSAGAACMNLLLAAHSLGFVGNWLTGWAAFSPTVIKSFGGEEGDLIAGFIFLGTEEKDIEERKRPDVKDIVHKWKSKNKE
ncbi:nitroreductase family protein [Zymomonas mobilis]|uniref:Putative NAD(P)H nitroreductase n=1 Tax=Zymomonas mobilis subsp. pomaceae (strain ATCC 29192 / DSM 22645 / JCM 10191 / CCUG 17912 / NBRC 13757 / NCIMB 11200 / NRRL B-4491 / Barker I) TaxID=579138 RepID=F8EUG5_ZYMMT|nr:nitroreductase [Zymomonas mobilis]AEI37181.1 nitroreductase [Zymomonas mobilis subsp. pomaceae ATCC 29192]MDX5948551.1 nitroreductase [Zymomonas mobilis subsp. pomaceae]GEB89859.1 nitroreductase [Zymomonas mobilis subsp. pomaceae]